MIAVLSEVSRPSVVGIILFIHWQVALMRALLYEGVATPIDWRRRCDGRRTHSWSGESNRSLSAGGPATTIIHSATGTQRC
jgi:hypothetical protein